MIARHSLAPAARAMSEPMRSVTPVALRAAEMTKTEATMIAGSLANPESAWAGERIPVTASASSVSIAATSMRMRSPMNSASVPATIRRNTICWLVIGCAEPVAAQIGWSIDVASGVSSFGPWSVMVQMSSIRMPNSPGM
jgi:hypothetical protein